MPDTTQASPVRRFGSFEINLQSGELRKNGMRLRLSGQPFQVLAALVQRPGELVTREELHSELWPSDTFVDFDHGLNNAVARIREVLDDSSDTPRYVETIPRRGYRFIAPLADVRPATVPLPWKASRVSSGSDGQPSIPSGTSIPLGEGRRGSPRLWLLIGVVIALGLFSLALILYHRTESAKGTKQPAIKSLAVLPLKNLSGDPTQEYLADGMTEAIIGRLSGIHDLRVISRTSVMRLKDTQLSVPEIAKTLSVDAVVEGSIIREGNRVRVHAQLIRAASDEHFWSEAYDRELSDAMALESDVAQAIARKVEVTVTGKESERLAAAPRVLPEAYENYLKGGFRLEQSNTRSEIEESIRYFQDAIRLDPNFAPAYVGLASAHTDLGTIIFGLEPENQRLEAAKAARKALELDPNLSDADDILALIDQQQWRWAAAEEGYRRALQHNPNDASAYKGLASWLLCQGRIEEALPLALRARELDRFGSSTYAVAWILFNARRYDEEIRELHSTLAVYPHDRQLLWDLGFALMLKGEPEQAIPALEEAASLANRSPGTLDVLTAAYARAGRRNDALRTLDELKSHQKKGYVPAGSFVNAYIGLGDNEQAFAWLEKAYKEHSNLLQFVKVHPLFDPVRHDPRFTDLVRRIGLG